MVVFTPSITYSPVPCSLYRWLRHVFSNRYEFTDHAVVIRRNNIPLHIHGCLPELHVHPAGVKPWSCLVMAWNRCRDLLHWYGTRSHAFREYSFAGYFSPMADLYLFLDQVVINHFFRNAVFYLDTGVHFHEIEITVFINQELYRSNTFIANGLGSFWWQLHPFLHEDHPS